MRLMRNQWDIYESILDAEEEEFLRHREEDEFKICYKSKTEQAINDGLDLGWWKTDRSGWPGFLVDRRSILWNEPDFGNGVKRRVTITCLDMNPWVQTLVRK